MKLLHDFFNLVLGGMIFLLVLSQTDGWVANGYSGWWIFACWMAYCFTLATFTSRNEP